MVEENEQDIPWYLRHAKGKWDDLRATHIYTHIHTFLGPLGHALNTT